MKISDRLICPHVTFWAKVAENSNVSMAWIAFPANRYRLWRRAGVLNVCARKYIILGRILTCRRRLNLLLSLHFLDLLHVAAQSQSQHLRQHQSQCSQVNTKSLSTILSAARIPRGWISDTVSGCFSTNLFRTRPC